MAVSVGAQSGTSFYQFGIPYLLPQVRSALGVSLFEGALLVAAPTAGMIATLLLWGWTADRLGDRPVMATGLLGAGACLVAVPLAGSALVLGGLLFLAGAFGASVNVTSGRVVLRSFGVSERGLAMGIRQTSPLIGMGLAALLLPGLGAAYGYAEALLVPAAICAAAACAAVVVIDPALRRPDVPRVRTPSPYRHPELWLLHSASALLVIPQIAVASFAFIYLVDVAGWTSATAGTWLAVAMAGGAACRLLAGTWSDRVGDRVAPMRRLALLAFAVVAATAALMLVRGGSVPAVLLPAAAVTSAWNGLAFTAVAETAGSTWAGRALGLQNTLQYVTTAATPPVMALAIGPGRYGWAFLGSSLAALVAFVLVPAGLSPAASPQQEPHDATAPGT
nr:MFS transporter [Nocardioides agariphilus]